MGCRSLLFSLLLLVGLSPGPVGWAQPQARPVDADARVLPAAGGELFAVAFSPDSRLVAGGGGDSAISLWDAATGQLLGTLRGHAGPVRALAFTRDGKWLASGSDDRTVRVWNVATRTHARTIGGHFGAVTALAFSPDQQVLASGSQNGSLRLLEFASGREIRAVKRGFATLHAAAFASDGLTLVTGSSDGRISLWDVASGQERGLTGHTGAVRGVALSPVEPLAASASADQTIRFWDLRSGREVAALAGHTGEVTALAFSPDGLLLASGGQDGTLRLWDVKARREQVARADQSGAIWALGFSPDGSMLATAGHDRQVRLRSPAALLASPSVGEILVGAIREGSTEVGKVSPSSPPLAVVAMTVSPTPAVTGSDILLTVKVTNRGKGPLYRFSARTSSPETALDNLEFFFGKVEADDSNTIAQAVRLSRELPDSELPVRVEFREDNGFVPSPIEARIFVKGEARPRFAYRYQVADDVSGNGDGRIQRGEAFDLLVTVKNTGLAPAQQGRLDVWSRSMRGLRIRGGSVDLGTLAPEQTRSARVPVEVAADFPTDQLVLVLSLRETGVNARLSDELKFRIDATPGPKPTSASRTVAVTAPGVLVHAGAGADTPVIAAVPGGQHLPVTGEAGDWYRVRVDPHDQGWVPRAAVADLKTAPASGPPATPHAVFQHAPPLVVLTAPPEGLRTGAALVELGGVAVSARGIARIDVSVNGRRAPVGAPAGPPAREPGPAGLRELAQKIPLDGGPNEIEVTVVDGNNQVVRHARRVFRTTQ